MKYMYIKDQDHIYYLDIEEIKCKNKKHTQKCISQRSSVPRIVNDCWHGYRELDKIMICSSFEKCSNFPVSVCPKE